MTRDAASDVGTPSETLRALLRGEAPLSIHAAVGVSLVCLGVAAFVYVAVTDPRGAPRRAATAYARGLDEKLRAMFMAPRGAYLAWTQLSGAIALVAMWGFLRLDAILYAAVAAVVLPPLVVRVMVQRRTKQLDGQVHGFALALANALRTTASIGDALWITLSVTAKPLKDELETAQKQVIIGSTLEDALLAMALRARSSALDVVVSALLIGRQTGGDLPRILDATSTSLRELKRLEELTERVTRSAKQSLAVAATITGGLAFFLPRVVPGFFDPLRDTMKGQLVAAQCALVFLLALFLGYRFTRRDI